MSLNGVTRNTTICTMYGKFMQTIQMHQGSETTIWGENETAKNGNVLAYVQQKCVCVPDVIPSNKAKGDAIIIAITKLYT